MMRPVLMSLAAVALGLPAAAQVAMEQRADMPAAVQEAPERSAAQIIAAAHAAAGGPTWVRPGSLYLTGYNIIRDETGGETVWDNYEMWRVFGATKEDAHDASGKVRIEASIAGEPVLLLAFDGTTTYTADGPMDDQSGSAMWSNSFGFGAIRNALDDGWTQERRPDRLINGEPAYMVELTDPSGSNTLFGIRQSDDAVVYVGFSTPRGWHERRYSEFFEKPGISWKQPGRVTLAYDGVVSNEAIWTDFTVGEDFPEDLFVIDGS